MNKVEEIFKAWNIAFNPDNEQAELASKRIEICNSCEHKVTNLGINRCSVCGCALKGKVFSPVKGACPKGKWDEIDGKPQSIDDTFKEYLEISKKNMVVKENLIYKFDNLVDESVCDRILDYYNKNYTNDLNDTSKLPWFEDNTIYWASLKNTEIKNDIELIRDRMTKCVEQSYRETIYPHVSTLVMWKEGKSMAIHKDNGYENDKHVLYMRKYTAVFYINDDYEGGETIVLKENSRESEIEYKAKKASLLIFRSDDSCLHGVKTVKKGNRLTFSMWFTDDETHKER